MSNIVMDKTAPITLDLNKLPDDLPLLKSLVKDLVAVLKDKETDLERLRHQLRQAIRRHFGRRSESIDLAQMPLFLKEIEEELSLIPQPPEVPAGVDDQKTADGHGRRKPSGNLPRQRTVYPLPDNQKTCGDCGHALRKIGEETRTSIEYIPASIVQKEEVLEKWACGFCQGNVVASQLPGLPVERGMAGAGMLAHVVTSKYADHLPLYRQAEIFSRQGFEVNRSTLGDWVGQVADLLEPIYDSMKTNVLQSKVLHTDDTPVPVLEDMPLKDEPPTGEDGDKKNRHTDDPFARHRARQARLWVYVGDASHPHTVYDYTPDRKREGPVAFLKGWRGFLQADAYAGYNGMYSIDQAIEVACWAHARRKFYDARTTHPSRAKAALAFIHQLYLVEKTAKLLDSSQRREMRQKHSKPILDAFGKWLRGQALILLPKSPMGEAIGYTLRQWDALNRYAEDGDLAADNNAAERALRCAALGRKNWMFLGGHEGGKRAAILFSLVTSCKRLKKDPFEYLRDVISRVATHPARRIDELLPASWTPSPVTLKPAEQAA